MMVHMKYSIGDKVFYREKEYQIKRWEVKLDNNGVHIGYVFHAYCDPNVGFHDVIPEGMLTPVDHNTEADVDLSMVDMDGDQVTLGDLIYTSIFYGRVGDDGNLIPYVDTRMAFAAVHSVDTITCYKDYESDHIIYDGYGRYVFPVSNKYGHAKFGGSSGSHFYISSSFKSFDPQKFAEKYVEECKSHRYEKNALLRNDDDMWDARVMLERLGALDIVKKLLAEKTSHRKAIAKKEKAETELDKWKKLVIQLSKISGVKINKKTISIDK